MNLKTTLFVFCGFFAIVASQEPKVSCKSESENQIIFSSYRVRTQCTFENIKSVEDVMRLRLKLTPKEQIASIFFVNSSMSAIPDKFFGNLGVTNVRKLDASRLVLDTIEKLAFSDVKTWDSVDFNNNQIRKLTDRVFASVTIRVLDLSYNNIETIEEYVFAGADIVKLSLAYNKLKSIAFASSFASFGTLDLNNNYYETLGKIDLTLNRDPSFASRRIIFESDFPKISLQRNKLTKIDCDISGRISALNVEENPDLAEISLRDCKVDTIDASNCQIVKFTSNDNLKSLTMKNTKVSEIDFKSAQSLTTLSLDNASLSSAVIEQVLKLENLTYLDLSHNNIGPLQISTFSKLKNLQSLLLKDANISNILFGTFGHQNQLKLFDISDNHLGYFDMNMIFSMSSLLTLDLSGNDLQTLDNYESSHFMFTLLTKIDLSGNKWPCAYLMKLVKIFRTYRVALARSNLEEVNTNLHGISCIHVAGDDDVISTLDTSANYTDIKEKMNEMIEEMGRNSEFKTSIDTRITRLEERIDNRLNSFATSASLKSERSETFEVKNSALLETALVIVCICFTVFMTLQSFNYIRKNFLGRPKPMRASSENPLI